MQKIEFAVKGLIVNGKKFLAVHKSDIQSSKYELPGGKMNFGETAEETLIRKIMEEVGVRVIPLKIIDTWNYFTETNQITGIIYLCVANNPEPIILSDEHDSYEWLDTDFDSLDKMNRLFKPQMLRWNWNEIIDIQKNNNEKLTAWNKFKSMIEDSDHENNLLANDAFNRDKSSRRLINY